jgi:hypothetical protein
MRRDGLRHGRRHFEASSRLGGDGRIGCREWYGLGAVFPEELFELVHAMGIGVLAQDVPMSRLADRAGPLRCQPAKMGGHFISVGRD